MRRCANSVLTADIPYDEDMPSYAAELYGMIHARYIITSHGLDAMVR